jgi:uncharacterized membrane protein YgdD (TMEM256/DUF423 family)
MSVAPLPALERVAAALAALHCGLAVALGAYAAHAAAPAAAERLERASLSLLLHGIAVLVFVLGRRPGAGNRLIWGLLLLGSTLFSGSLVALALAALPPTLAPLGGILMMLGWLWAGLHLLRRSI